MLNVKIKYTHLNRSHQDVVYNEKPRLYYILPALGRFCDAGTISLCASWVTFVPRLHFVGSVTFPSILVVEYVTLVTLVTGLTQPYFKKSVTHAEMSVDPVFVVSNSLQPMCVWIYIPLLEEHANV